MFTPGTAHALSCATNQPSFPVAGDVNVPTNTLFWGYSAGGRRLLGPSGEVVPMVERAIVVSQTGLYRWTFPILVPSQNLQPHTRYRIEVAVDGGASPHVTEFVTGAGPAIAPPQAPELVAAEPRVGAGTRWIELQFQEIGERGLILIGDAGHSGNGEEGEVATVADLLIDSSPSAEALAEAPLVEWIAEDGALAVGIADCVLWPEGAPDALPARFGAFDLAGNFSGWVDVPLQLPSEAEAQAVADEQGAAYGETILEAQRVAAANRAKLASASQDSGCATVPAPAGGRSALTLLLALGLAGVARRKWSRV